MQLQPQLSYDAAAQGHRFDFAVAAPRILTIAFTLLWFAGWSFLLLLIALDYIRFGGANLAGVVLMVVGGAPVAIALSWAVLGKRESLIVTASELRIYRWAGPIRVTRSIGAATVAGLRVVAVPSGPFSDFYAVRQFYGAGCGSLAIDTTRRTLSVGHTLPPEAARQLVEQIRSLLPQLATSATGSGPRRRAIDYAAGFMTASLVGFAVTMPGRLLLTDRPICFYDGSLTPRRPIDVTAMRPPGRVYLVPIGDFPIDRATAIADHFRTKFGVAIEVAAAVAWPDEAWVERRRQMDSAQMLTRLESIYGTRDSRAVAIGLTKGDMFNSNVNWHYVFSYRHNNRVAVVSPARMDRGCMGLFQADDDRIMARLRKMVGKNIGIMYFGLELSADPRSMLYANIGGPQELDAMSEQF